MQENHQRDFKLIRPPVDHAEINLLGSQATDWNRMPVKVLCKTFRTFRAINQLSNQVFLGYSFPWANFVSKKKFQLSAMKVRMISDFLRDLLRINQERSGYFQLKPRVRKYIPLNK